MRRHTIRDLKGRFATHPTLRPTRRELSDSITMLRKELDNNASTDDIVKAAHEVIRVMGNIPGRLLASETNGLHSVLDHPNINGISTHDWHTITRRASETPAEDDAEEILARHEQNVEMFRNRIT